VPRKQLLIFALITVVAVAAGLLTGVVSVYLRGLFEHWVQHL
jgi:uncharacterized protein involved in exopolysaccharide biosynthesis